MSSWCKNVALVSKLPIHQCCIHASCRLYRIDTLLKGEHDLAGNPPVHLWCSKTTGLRRYAAFTGWNNKLRHLEFCAERLFPGSPEPQAVMALAERFHTRREGPISTDKQAQEKLNLRSVNPVRTTWCLRYSCSFAVMMQKCSLGMTHLVCIGTDPSELV